MTLSDGCSCLALRHDTPSREKDSSNPACALRPCLYSDICDLEKAQWFDGPRRRVSTEAVMMSDVSDREAS